MKDTATTQGETAKTLGGGYTPSRAFKEWSKYIFTKTEVQYRRAWRYTGYLPEVIINKATTRETVRAIVVLMPAARQRVMSYLQLEIWQYSYSFHYELDLMSITFTMLLLVGSSVLSV